MLGQARKDWNVRLYDAPQGREEALRRRGLGDDRLTPEQELCGKVTAGHCWIDPYHYDRDKYGYAIRNTEPSRECRHCGFKQKERTTREWLEVVPLPEGTIR